MSLVLEKSNKLIAAALLTLAINFSSVFAQSSTSSPYSRYGFGELSSMGTAQNFFMGGAGVAIQNTNSGPFFINSTNPASYVNSPFTIFDAGVISNTTKLSDKNKSAIVNNTSVNYLSFLVPINKWWGSSVGFKPFSNVGYKITDKEERDGVGQIDYLYEGYGGINQLYWGNGFKVKNLYAGFNASYLFGNLVNSRYVILPDTSNSYNFKSVKTTRINDLSLNYGLQYVLSFDTLQGRVLKDKVTLIIGATASTQTNISATNDVVSYTYETNAGFINGEKIKDTLENTSGINGQIVLPLKLTYGISFRKGDKWLITADYSSQNWSQYSFFGENAKLKNTMSISTGARYVPDPKGDAYLKKVAYHAGVRYAQTPIVISNTKINETAFTLGAGFPVGKSRQSAQSSVFSVGVELGQRGTTENGLIQERFAKVVLGFTMNDKWFNKPKFD